MVLPKYVGRDCELSTTGTDAEGRAIDSCAVTRDVLRQITPTLGAKGVAVWSGDRAWQQDRYYTPSPYSMDCLRNWTGAGQNFYHDMGHVEVCTCAALIPRSFAAQSISTLLAAEAARKAAEAEAPDRVHYDLGASNADMLDAGISFGSHVSVSVEPRLWHDLTYAQNRPARLAYVSSALAAGIPFFGAGYILPLKDGPSIFSLSARAHHLSYIKTLSTTMPWKRGIINERHEPHGDDHERLHLIGFDYSMVASAPMCSFLQCMLAAAEEGYCDQILVDPVRALRSWSWGLDLQTGKPTGTATLVGGRKMTLPAYMRELVENLLEMCAAGLITEQAAPEAKEMLSLILELTHYAEEGSILRCARHLDWAAKLMSLVNLCKKPGVQLGDARTRVADHDFSNTDPQKGELWQLWDRGLVDPLVKMSDAEACLVEGPPESRDWGRGKIIQKFAADISDVDWSYVSLRRDNDRWSPRFRIDMPSLDSFNKANFESIITQARSADEMEQLLQDNANARQADPITEVKPNLALPN